MTHHFYCRRQSWRKFPVTRKTSIPATCKLRPSPSNAKRLSEIPFRLLCHFKLAHAYQRAIKWPKKADPFDTLLTLLFFHALSGNILSSFGWKLLSARRYSQNIDPSNIQTLPFAFEVRQLPFRLLRHFELAYAYQRVNDWLKKGYPFREELQSLSFWGRVRRLIPLEKSRGS